MAVPGSLLALLLLAGAVSQAAGDPGAADFAHGVDFYRTEDYRQAQSSFERAAARDPGNSKYRLWVGLAIGRRAEGMTGLRRVGAAPLAKQAKRHFERAVELDEENLDALEALQGFHFRAPGLIGGSKAEAVKIAVRIEAIDQARGSAAWAAVHEDAGDFDKAAESHLRARELAPEDIGYLVSHAAYLSRRRQHAESDELFAAALARDPDDPDACLEAGKAWLQAKRRALYPRAKELLERYLASPTRKPNSDPPSHVRKLLKKL